MAYDWTQDAGCEGAWLFSEGTGTTVDNAEGTTSLDGAFKGAGEPAWASMTGTGAPAYSSYMVDFDGTDDYVDCGTDSNVLAYNQSLAHVAWINPDADHAGSILSKRDIIGGGGGNVDFRIMNDVSKSLRFRVQGNTSMLRQSVANAITTGQWNHVAVIWDGSTTAANILLYVNGSEVTYQTTTDGSSLTINDLGRIHIGNIHENLVHFNGKIGEVATFSSGIDSTDINDIMTNGLKQTTGAATGFMTTMKGYW
jgi:hypothetical protein